MKSFEKMEKHKNLITNLQKKSKNAQTWFSHQCVPSFNQEQVWDEISKRLDQIDKRLMSWFMALATSFTLLVAAGLEYADQSWEFNKEKHKPAEISMKQEPIRAVGETSEIVTLTSIPFIEQMEQTISIPEKLIIDSSKDKTIKTKDSKNKDPQKLVGPSVKIEGSLGVSRDYLAPGVGLDIQVFEWNHNQKIHSISVGWQGQFINTQLGEERAIEWHTAHFVNAKFIINNMHNKGWTFGASYLINPDEIVFKEKTIKVTALRNVSRNIKIGPEVIFTANLKQIIPTFSLVVSS